MLNCDTEDGLTSSTNTQSGHYEFSTCNYITQSSIILGISTIFNPDAQGHCDYNSMIIMSQWLQYNYYMRYYLQPERQGYHRSQAAPELLYSDSGHQTPAQHTLSHLVLTRRPCTALAAVCIQL